MLQRTKNLIWQCLLAVLGLCIAVLWTGAQSQQTPVNLGCTFTDKEHVYNVHLAPGDRSLPCPDAEAAKQHLKVYTTQNSNKKLS